MGARERGPRANRPDGRRSPDVSHQKHHPERGQLQGSHNARRRGQDRRAGADPGGTGPFTVFAPTNEAFAALPPGTVDSLLKPEKKDQLVKVLTYHVVPGRYDATTLIKDCRTTAGGRVSLKTVEGEPLIVSEKAGKLMITDAKGGVATVTIPDVFQSNGIIMVVDKVLMP